MNPSQREVEEMVRDVDPSATGTFNQNALVSLIARRPRKEYSLEEIIEAIRICTNTGETEGEGKDKVIPNKMSVVDFITAMDSMGKSTGEDLGQAEVQQIIRDSNLENDNQEIVIEDFAKYLLSR